MSKRPAYSIVAGVLLFSSLIVPATLLVAPRRAAADAPLACIGGVATGIAAATANLIKSVPSGDLPAGSATWSTYGTTLGECLYTYVVIPFARMLIRNFLQDMTQRTIAWISGTGAPGGQRSFVPNLSVHLQFVGDSVATAFINQLRSGLQSPFDLAIASSIRAQYLQGSSLAGFFSQYRSTLGQVSPNVNAFLGGNWAQGGGVSSWLALTTQPQNNPYLLYQAAAAQLGSNLASAQTNRRQDLIQSGGFLSFCPQGTTSGGSAANPQAQCTNADGTPAQATTPGSVIMSYLQTNVNSGVGQLVSAQDLDGALFAVVQALASRVLNSVGLFGNGGGGSGGRPGIPSVPNPSTPNPGTSAAISAAQSTLSSVSTYRTAWNTIQSAASAAQSAVTTLRTSCSAELSLGRIGTMAITSADVTYALNVETLPVISLAQNAFQTASTAQALANQVIAEANNTTTSGTQLANDVLTLSTMPPSASDVASATQNAQTTGGATARPSGSLTVTGGSLVDQMNLITANANALAPQCAGYIPTGGGPGPGPGTVLNGGTLPNLYGTNPSSVKYITPAVNQTACFDFTLNPQDVGTARSLFWTTTPQITGGNITYWISQTSGGQPVVAGCTSYAGQPLPACTETKLFSFTDIMKFTASASGTYYWCLKLDTAGNQVGAQLFPGQAPSGG